MLVHGHDQSSYLISLAQERASFQSVANQAFFTVGDCRQIPYDDNTFDLIILMGNSFGYFADEDSDRVVLSEINRVLVPGGRLVIDITDGAYMRENFAERSWEWADDSTFVCRERQLSDDGLRLNSREIITVTNKGVVRDQFYQERLYSQTELTELLLEAGLEVAEKAKEVSSETIITIGYDMSKRKEDLGMMEQRMLVNAVKPLTYSPKPILEAPIQNAKKDSYPTVTAAINDSLAQLSVSSDSSAPSLSVPEVTVLLGDPSMDCFGKLNNKWNQEDIETRKKLIIALNELGYSHEKLKLIDNHSDLSKQLEQRRPSFVFNLCDEGYNNDAQKELHIPVLLEVLGIPYSGAGPNCLAYCYDKGLVNRSAETLGVPAPRELTYLADVTTPEISDLDKLDQLISEKILYPAFIKPIKGDNSLGITGRSIIRNRSDLKAYIEELSSIGIRNVLIQEYLQGTEYGVGMVGNPETSGFHFFPILEVDYTKIIKRDLPPILGFESKWDPESPYWSEISYKRASLSPQVEEKLKKMCTVLWERFECRDYARFDFRCDVGRGDGFDGLNGTIKLLEVNPNPGWCWDGKLAYMAKLDGISYKDMLGMILKSSIDRVKVEN